MVVLVVMERMVVMVDLAKAVEEVDLDMLVVSLLLVLHWVVESLMNLE